MAPDDGSAIGRRELLAGAALCGVLGLGTACGVASADAESPGTMRQAGGGSGLSAPSASGAQSLPALAQSKNLLLGALVDIEWLKDPHLQAALARDCEVIGIANGFNWTRTQPRPDMTLDWSQAEAIDAWARANGKRTGGHNVIWNDDVLPAWLRQRLPGLPPAAVGDLMAAHVRDTSDHWRGRLTHLNVVNEPVTSVGLRDTLWNRKLGERYIDLAFATAADADRATLRVLNQDWIELDSREHAGRRAMLLGLLERLLARNVPIEALGIQGHLQANFSFSERVWRQFLDEVVGMGLKLLVTEFDVYDGGLIGDTATRDQDTAALLGAFLDVTLSYPECIGLISQSWTDRFDWLSMTPSKARADHQPLRPNPLDRDFAPKPLYQAIAASLRAAPRR